MREERERERERERRRERERERDRERERELRVNIIFLKDTVLCTCLLQYLLEDVEAMFQMAIREVGESEDAPKSCSCNEKSVHVCV